MTYRHLGFMLIMFYLGIFLNNQVLKGNLLAALGKTPDKNLKHGNASNNSPNLTSVSDTLKHNIVRSGKSDPDFPADMVIQVGAFIRETNAKALKIRLSDLLNQEVIIVPENNFFKVRISGCKSIEEMGKLVEALGLLGIKNVWVFHNRPKEELIALDSVKSDTIAKAVIDNLPVPMVMEEPPAAEPTINLQVGVFHSKSQALRAQRRIIAKLGLPVEIVQEWEYYIVFVTGFKTREEMFIYYPRLAALGYPDSFMVDRSKPAGATNKNPLP